MTDRLTPQQFITLEFIATCPKGRTMLHPSWWRDRHHQRLIERGLLRLPTDPFKSKATLLYGSITAKGRKAVSAATANVRAKAKELSDRAFEAYQLEAAE
jgi:hypothetical protein